MYVTSSPTDRRMRKSARCHILPVLCLASLARCLPLRWNAVMNAASAGMAIPGNSINAICRAGTAVIGWRVFRLLSGQ